MEATETEKPNCPECGNNKNVYEVHEDPQYGTFVLCSLHGMQVCDERKRRLLKADHILKDTIARIRQERK